jgi:hypothetical protein
MSRIKRLSDEYGREIGGDIEEYEDDQGRKYIRLTNISIGEEYQVIRGGEGGVKFHTHPIKLEELKQRLEERTHFDMPSHADFLNFCIDNRYIIIEKQNNIHYIYKLWKNAEKVRV